MSAMRYVGRMADMDARIRSELFDRAGTSGASVRQSVADIIAQVRRNGDAALRELASRFDGVTLTSLEVPMDECRRALDRLDAAVRQSMERSARNIRAVHEACRPPATLVEPERGIRILRRPDPLARVGVYAPGGRAVYPSSVLMGAVPARAAGVREVILCSPPDRTGRPTPIVLGAAALAGVDRVFAIGGAGAIAAMAYGTDTIPRVNRVVGPGNAYVAEAKLQVSSAVAIDSPAGPSELLVLCDDSADARQVAVECVAQAEHDPEAAVMVVCVGPNMRPMIARAVDGAAAAASRRQIVADALASRGAVLEAKDWNEAVTFANEWAPEHLLLVARTPEQLVPQLTNAGTIFVGATSSVAFGDYMTGANHVLPTGGLARSYSGLSTVDFVRWTTVQTVDRAAAGRMASDVGALADVEGLPGHAAAARQWSAP